MKNGIQRITAERKRQIDKEGWDKSHDEQHDLFQLSVAAGCYIANAHNKHFGKPENFSPCSNVQAKARFQINTTEGKWVDGWPWTKEWDKRDKHGIIRSLEIAGALIAAEIDRLQATE